MRIFAALVICMILAGCNGMALGKGGLYLNKSTCVGMDELGVAKMNNKF